MPSMTRAQKEEAARKRAKAVELGQSPTGVTDVELAAAVGSKAVGAMAAILSRMKKVDHMRPAPEKRAGRTVWFTTSTGSAAYEGGAPQTKKPRVAKKAAKVIDVREELARTAQRVSHEAHHAHSHGASDISNSVIYQGLLEIINGSRSILSGVEKVLHGHRMRDHG